MEVPETLNKVYEALSLIPPDFDAAEKLFAGSPPSQEELMWLAVELEEESFGEYTDVLFGDYDDNRIPGRLHRDQLYDVILFLLDHGMDPNAIVGKGTMDEDNVMLNLKFVDGPAVAARVMRLLMEHGGDPNLDVDGRSSFWWADTELCMDPIYEREICDGLVELVMVMQAYDTSGEEGAFVMREGYSSKLFKEFEKFDYRFGKEEGYPGNIHVFEKATGKTVADYE